MPSNRAWNLQSEPFPWLRLAAALVALKLVVGAFDPTLRFFLGDSESYLHAAFTGWVPGDRSFVYGLFLRVGAVAAGSWIALVALQSLCGVLTALLCARIAYADLRVDRRYAMLVACLVAVEPSQLFYERMVMAESLGTLNLVLMFACGLAYAHDRRWPWLAAMALAGIAAVSLRMSLLPIVLGFAALPPLVALCEYGERRSWLRAGVHLAVAVASTAAAHAAYKRLYGYVANVAPTYLVATGTFRLGLVAPLVKPEHLERVGLPRDLLASVGPPLADPRAREAQLWLGDGLLAAVHRAAGDRAEIVARKLAARALRDDIPGFLALSAATTADYFEPGVVGHRMNDDLGTRALSATITTAVQERLGYDATGVHERFGPVARYFAASGPWLTFCLFAIAPLALFAFVRRWRHRRAPALLFALGALGLVAGQMLFSHIVSFRYLHPFAPLTLVALAAAFAPLSRRVAPIDPPAR